MTGLPKTLVVIADAEHARLVLAGAGAAPHTEITLTAEEAGLRTSDLVTDSLGRSFESSGGTRHAIEPRSDAHRKAGQRFAALVAARVNAELPRLGAVRVVLVAPPRTLHALEAGLDPAVLQRLVERLAKDLTKVPDEDLAEHLPELARPPRLGPGRSAPPPG